MNAYADFMTALQHLRRDDGHARFGAAKPCCDGCAEAAKVNPAAKPCCGGDKTPRFGYSTTAPPPPYVNMVTGDWTTKDLLAYTSYVLARVKEMDQAWADWHDASKWDNGGAGCTPKQVADLTAQIDAGQITVDQAARTCHAEYYDQLDKADAWNKTVTGSLLGDTWPIWSQGFHDRAAQILQDGLWQQATEWTYSRLPEMQQYHKELVDYAHNADTRGLKNTPDPGAPPDLTNVQGLPKLPTFPETSDLFNSAALLLLVGGGIFLLASRK